MTDSIVYIVLNEDELRKSYDESVADWQWYAENDPAKGYPRQREDPTAKHQSWEEYRAEMIKVFTDELISDNQHRWGFRITLSTEEK